MTNRPSHPTLSTSLPGSWGLASPGALVPPLFLNWILFFLLLLSFITSFHRILFIFFYPENKYFLTICHNQRKVWACYLERSTRVLTWPLSSWMSLSTPVNSFPYQQDEGHRVSRGGHKSEARPHVSTKTHSRQPVKYSSPSHPRYSLYFQHLQPALCSRVTCVNRNQEAKLTFLT